MKAIRLGICVLVMFCVLAFGGVEVWSESILEIGAAFLLLWWAILVLQHRDIEIHLPAICWPLFAFVGIASLQLALGATTYAFLTKVALMKLLACVLLFFLSIQSFRTGKDLRFFVWFLMFLGFAVAVLGIVQNYTSHNMLLWFRPLTEGGDPFGPYVNRNDFAGLMELIVPFGVSAVVLRAVRGEQVLFVSVLALLPIVALILTGSRGGIASFLVEMALLTALVRVGRGKFHAIGIAMILVVAVGIVGWLGAGKVMGRIRTSPSLSEISSDRRVSMLKGAWNIFLDYPLAGRGLGTLVAVFPKYETAYDGRIVDHVHNDYAELLAETGALGGLVGLIFLILLFGGAIRLLAEEQNAFSQAAHIGAIVACSGLLVHSFVDFNLHIPANGLLFLLLASLAVSPTFRSRVQGVPLSART